MGKHQCDIAILGGGPAGYVAAIRAAQLGFQTTLIERRKTLGGTCLNIGCIPSKALLASSEHYAFAKHDAASHGILLSGVQLDLGKLLGRKDKLVAGLVGGIDGLFRKHKIQRLTGEGKVTAPGTLHVTVADGSTDQVDAKHIVLATGSVPSSLPGVPFDGENVVSSTEALCFSSIPDRLLVIGAGAIGLELGSVWARLGSKVTVVEFLPRIAPGFDAGAAEGLRKALEKQGLTFHLETGVESVAQKSSTLVTQAKVKGEAIVFESERILVAVGRKPFLQDAVDKSLALALDERGRVKTDAQFRTNIPGLYAIGDVIAGPMLAHKAEEEGVACVERIAGLAGHVNYGTIPGVIYTDPELAGVGLTEEDAKDAGREVAVGKFPFAANGRALATGATTGFVKIIADAKTDRLLGAHILGAGASELIQEAVSVMEFEGSAEDLARTVHAHPTLAEAVKEAALSAGGRPIHITR